MEDFDNDPRVTRLRELRLSIRDVEMNTPECEAMREEIIRLTEETGYGEGAGMGDPDLGE